MSADGALLARFDETLGELARQKQFWAERLIEAQQRFCANESLFNIVLTQRLSLATEMFVSSETPESLAEVVADTVDDLDQLTENQLKPYRRACSPQPPDAPQNCADGGPDPAKSAEFPSGQPANSPDQAD